MIEARLDGRGMGKTINELAKEGKIAPVEFTANGKRYKANSVWAATDWLEANGFYKVGCYNVIWHLEGRGR